MFFSHLFNFMGVLSLASAGTIRHQPRDDTADVPEISSKFTVGSTEYTLNDGGGYPRVLKLSDGGVLSVQTVPHVDGKTRSMQVSKSTDGAKTFQLFGEIIRSDDQDISNGVMLELPRDDSGEAKRGPPILLAAYRKHDLNKAGKKTYYRITVSRSEDGGETWKELGNVYEKSAQDSNGLGVWEPFMRVAKDGSVQLTYSGEIARDNQETFQAVSRDGGESWTEPVNLRLHSEDETMRDGMQSIVSVKDLENGADALVLAMEVKKGKTVRVDYVVSYDDGMTWGNRSGIYDPQDETKSAGAPWITNIGDSIVSIFMTDEDIEQVNWAKKAGVKVLFADGVENGVVNWTKSPLLISKSPSSWPGITQLEENTVMATYGYKGSPRGRLVKKQELSIVEIIS
ncbi:Sialidase [Hypoxylon sp. FL1284]|nr:Sialidase [Hypoxylon sp. FL1284]